MKTGATVWASGMLYKATSQTVTLYGSGSWVVTGDMLKMLEGFHHIATQRIAGILDRCAEDG